MEVTSPARESRLEYASVDELTQRMDSHERPSALVGRRIGYPAKFDHGHLPLLIDPHFSLRWSSCRRQAQR